MCTCAPCFPEPIYTITVHIAPHQKQVYCGPCYLRTSACLPARTHLLDADTPVNHNSARRRTFAYTQACTSNISPSPFFGFVSCLAVTELINDIPIRPRIMGRLVPQQVNLWLGNNRDGSTSGLHHDFHDNIYVLLRGRKRYVGFRYLCWALLAISTRISVFF